MAETVYDVLNKVMAIATRADFEPEVRKANAEFFARTGQVKEDDITFEARMSLFLEWYLFNRPLDAQGVTPLQYLIQNPSPEFSEEEMAVLRELVNYRHSIFEFLKAKDSTVFVRDLVTKQKEEITERRGTKGFVKGAVFEARVLNINGILYFSGPMLFHPVGAKKFIKDSFKKDPSNVEEKIFVFSAMQLKFERYRHVPQEKIYCYPQVTQKTGT